MSECVTMTGKEAAQHLGISYCLILELAKRREIPCIRAGRRVLFRKETLDTWIRNQEMQSVQSKVVSENNEYGKLRQVKA